MIKRRRPNPICHPINDLVGYLLNSPHGFAGRNLVIRLHTLPDKILIRQTTIMGAWTSIEAPYKIVGKILPKLERLTTILRSLN